MLNEVMLVGKLKSVNPLMENKQEIQIEIERSFDDRVGRIYDSFTCQLWHSIFSKVISVCKNGDILAIKGRLVNENEQIFVIAEKVVIINKNINKNSV